MIMTSELTDRPVIVPKLRERLLQAVEERKLVVALRILLLEASGIDEAILRSQFYTSASPFPLRRETYLMPPAPSFPTSVSISSGVFL